MFKVPRSTFHVETPESQDLHILRAGQHTRRPCHRPSAAIGLGSPRRFGPLLGGTGLCRPFGTLVDKTARRPASPVSARRGWFPLGGSALARPFGCWPETRKPNRPGHSSAAAHSRFTRRHTRSSVSIATEVVTTPSTYGQPNEIKIAGTRPSQYTLFSGLSTVYN